MKISFPATDNNMKAECQAVLDYVLSLPDVDSDDFFAPDTVLRFHDVIPGRSDMWGTWSQWMPLFALKHSSIAGASIGIKIDPENPSQRIVFIRNAAAPCNWAYVLGTVSVVDLEEIELTRKDKELSESSMHWFRNLHLPENDTPEAWAANERAEAEIVELRRRIVEINPASIFAERYGAAKP